VPPTAVQLLSSGRQAREPAVPYDTVTGIPASQTVPMVPRNAETFVPTSPEMVNGTMRLAVWGIALSAKLS